MICWFWVTQYEKLTWAKNSHISPTEFGLYDKYKEISFAPMPGIEFLGMEIDSITREGTKSSQDLSEPSQESLYNSSGIDQGCGPPIIDSVSSGTCKDSVKVSSTATN